MPLLTIEVIHRFILPDLATPAIMGAINQTRSEIMAAIDDLQREVQENRDATQSAITLLGNLKTKLDEAIAAQDWSRVQDLSNTLSANTDALAAAVVANTPADPNAGGDTGGDTGGGTDPNAGGDTGSTDPNVANPSAMVDRRR